MLTRGRSPIRVAFALALLGAVASACASLASAPTPSPSATPSVDNGSRGLTAARVISVVDGVTIDVDVEGQAVRVRYLGIEVPESTDPALRERALQFNRFLVGGRTVQLEEGGVDTDASGRLLRYVYVGGEMANRALLTNGYAAVAGFPSDFQHKTSFAVAQEAARSALRGLWEPHSDPAASQASPTPVPRFEGGTLPVPPGREMGAVCDYSDSETPVIKGNLDPRTREKTYHVPGGFFYSTTEVTPSEGDGLFCTEAEAAAAGFGKAKH